MANEYPKKDERKPDGAFWKKTAKSGNVYYSGHIIVGGEKMYLAMFPNLRKKNDTHPDFDIKISENQSK